MPGPGRSYTMAEMKAIVDYLVEHRAYGQTKARVMWQKFEETRVINRSWQSMKETFLKRILPDIHNNYYKLTPEQKRSFREGYDVGAYNANRLEIHRSEDSSNSGESGNVDLPSTSRNAGEDVQPSNSKSPCRASTETVVLENCYETTDDLIRELESPRDDPESPTKSMRDFISYSEPLTPIAQEVIDDFATDEDEPQLQIVEDNEPVVNGNGDSNTNPSISKVSTEIRKSLRMSPNIPVTGQKQKKKSKKDCDSESSGSTKSLRLKKGRVRTVRNKNKATSESSAASEPKTNGDKDQTEQDIDQPQKEKVADDNPEEIQNKKATKGRNSTTDCTNTTDTQLPNNQEQLGNKSDVGNLISNDKRLSTEGSISGCQDVEKNKKPGKRSRSVSSTDPKVKLRKDTEQEIKNAVDKNTQGPVSGFDVENVACTPTFDSHPNIQPNRTVEKENETFISHGNLEKPATDKTQDTAANETGKNMEKEAEHSDRISTVNPCLQSVNLYAERFSTTKYSDSESDDEPTKVASKDQPKINTKGSKVQGSSCEVQKNNDKIQDNSNKVQANHDKVQENIQHEEQDTSGENAKKETGTKITENRTKKNTFTENVVVHDRSPESLSEADTVIVRKKTAPPENRVTYTKKRILDKSRLEALANVFGHSSGLGASRKRMLGRPMKPKPRRHVDHRRRTTSMNISNETTMDWSSTDHFREREDMYEFRNFVPPACYPIEEEGVLCNYDDKMHPLVRSRRHINDGTNFYFVRGSESNDEENPGNYWKTKYMEESKKLSEERIRAEELSRLLQHTNQMLAEMPRARYESRSPLIPPTLPADRKSNQDAINTAKTSNEVPQKPMDEQKEDHTVKITFSNVKAMDCPIEMECKLTHVPFLLESMASTFRSNGEPQQKGDSNLRKTEGGDRRGDESRIPTPEVREKVAKLESEIFKEIQDRAEGESHKVIDDSNVTKRKRGRPRKTSPSASLSLEVECGSSKSVSSAEEVANKSPRPKISKQSNAGPSTSKESEKATVPSKRPAREKKKVLKDYDIKEPPKAKPSRSTLSMPARNSVTIPEDDHVRYKLPITRSKSLSATRTANKNSSSYLEASHIILSPECTSRHSIESSQGYQDSDSDFSPKPYKKKKKPTSDIKRKRRTSYANCHPYQADVDTYDNSCTLESPSKAVKDNSACNTSEYKSESYQLLMPKPKPKTAKLDQIDENSNDIRKLDTRSDTRYFSLSPISVQVDNDFEAATVTKITETNSSNISLLSPEISVVERLSISKDALSIPADHPTLNECQAMETSGKSATSKYVMSDVDVTMPLMEQTCGMRKSIKNSTSVSEHQSSVASCSILNKIDAVDIDDESSSDSLDLRLRNLLLESAKKMVQQLQMDKESQKESLMEIDDIVKTVKKARGKRCSTPHKAKRSRARSALKEPILEEHTEFCSAGGRQSCPPVINVVTCESPPREEDAVENSNIETENATKRSRRQKDVIKVKIQRPRQRSLPKEKRASSSCRLSVCTDSGINEESTMQASDDSVELIHNHSETCLQANECIGDSIEYIEFDTNAVITLLSSDSEPLEAIQSAGDEDEILSPPSERMLDNDVITAELFCSDARHATGLDSVRKPGPQGGDNSGSLTASLNSLITEDLSDESPPSKNSKWYLLSEDETNTNTDARSNDVDGDMISFGAHSNLQKLFPNACAVPDLSTISEGSREDSRKPSYDSNSTIY